MNQAARSAPPSRRATGLVLAVAVHLLLGYAFVSGLARKAVDLIRLPLEVSIADDVRQAPDKTPAPKPVPRAVASPPKAVTPAPVPSPVAAKPAVSAEVAAPMQAPAPAPSAIPAEPVSAALVCPNHLAVRNQVQYPAKALRMGLTGQADVEFIVTRNGEIRDIEVVRSSNPVFNAAAVAATAQLKCTGQGRDLRVRIPFTFRLEN